MTVRNTTTRWGPVSQFLHWLIVALIITQIILANIALDLPVGVRKLAMFARHKSVGLTILALAVIRLLWRWANPTPELPPDLKPYEQIGARVTHAALYLLLFAMPLTGWMMTSARGFPVSWFNLFQLPDFVPKSQSLYETMKDTHDTLAMTLYVVASVHALAALRHHFLKKDDVLRRMLPFSLLVPALLVTGASLALAQAPAVAPFKLDPSHSTLEFQFVQAGAQNKGKFDKLAVSLSLPADAGLGGKLDVVVDVGSLNTGDKDRDDTLRGADLFDVSKFPQAHFTSTQLKKTANGYEAPGKLTIRGVTRDQPVTLTWRPAQEQGVPVGYLTGKTTIRRLDFGVGQEDWKSTEWVGNEVIIAYNLRLIPTGH